MNRILGFWLAILLIFSGGMLVYFVSKSRPDVVHVGAASHPDPAGEQPFDRPQMDKFTLTDQTGAQFDSDVLRGKVWTGSFFFAACPSTCYQQNIKLQQLHAKYAEQGLEIVSITCDPANDTPVALAGYASRFNANPANWKFLTPIDGDMAYIRRVGNEYFGVLVGEETHTDRVVLFDRNGQISGTYSVLKPDQFRELDRKIGEMLQAPAEEQGTPAANGDGAQSADSTSSDAEPSRAESTANPSSATLE